MHSEDTGGATHTAVSATGGADDRIGAGAAPFAVTVTACNEPVNARGLSYAGGGLFQGYLQIQAKVCAPQVFGAGAAAAFKGAEESIEDIGESPEAEVGDCGTAGMTVEVILAAPFRVGENFIGLGRFFETVFGLCIIGVDIRVVLTGEPPVSPLDLLR